MLAADAKRQWMLVTHMTNIFGLQHRCNRIAVRASKHTIIYYFGPSILNFHYSSSSHSNSILSRFFDLNGCILFLSDIPFICITTFLFEVVHELPTIFFIRIDLYSRRIDCSWISCQDNNLEIKLGFSQ